MNEKNFHLIALLILSATLSCCGQSKEIQKPKVEPVQISPPLRKIFEIDRDLMDELAVKSEYSEELAKFDEFLQAEAKKYRFSGDILIGYRSQTLYYNSFGYANPVSKDSLQHDQRFQLASVSKQFAAASILRLEERDSLNIEDLVVKYLPDFKFKNVQIKHLLNHSAGLPDYLYLMEALWKDEELPDNEDVLYLVNEKVRALGFAPGTQNAYSNTGYVTLALIIEKVSGKSYPDFLRDEFFNPLKMENTFVYRGTDEKIVYPEHLVGYDVNEGKYTPVVESVNNGSYGDKGIYTTAKDLHKWFRALKGGKLLTEESMKRMFYYKGYEKDQNGFGMGFKLAFNKSGKIKIYHNGRWEGFRNGLVYYPHKDIYIIVLSHTSNKGKNIIQEDIEDRILALIKVKEAGK